jgi:hypothetical protein
VLFERCIARRVAITAGALLAVLAGLAGLLLLRRVVGKDPESLADLLTSDLAADALRFAALAVSMALPLALLLVLLELRRSGTWTAFALAGLSPARLRRTVLLAASATFVAALAAHALAERCDSSDAHAALWRTGEWFAWSPASPCVNELDGLVLFAGDGLDLWTAERAVWSGPDRGFATDGLRPVFGAVAPPGNLPGRAEPSIFSAECLALLNPALAAALLCVLAGYAGLLLPSGARLAAVAGFVVALLVAAVLVLLLARLSAAHPRSAIAVAAAAALLAAGALARIDLTRAGSP